MRTLRYYDSIDLLVPARVDAATGTRFYSADQFADLNQIVALKDLGMGLDQIRQILDEQISNEEIMGMLRLRHAEVIDNLRIETRRLHALEARLNDPSAYLTGPGVVTKHVPVVPETRP